MPLRAGTHPWLVISVTGRSSPPLTDADQTCIWPPWLLRKSTRVRSTDSCGQSPPSPVKRTAAPPSTDAFQMDSGRSGVEINPVAIPRPERIRSVGRSRGKSPRRPSVPVHDVEFGIAGSAQIEDDPATIWRPACPPNPRPSEESQLDGIRSIAVAHPDLRA